MYIIEKWKNGSEGKGRKKESKIKERKGEGKDRKRRIGKNRKVKWGKKEERDCLNGREKVMEWEKGKNEVKGKEKQLKIRSKVKQK